jgi:hypothetical protein
MNNKGFALAIMVPLLPVLLALSLASYAVMTFIQIEQKFSYTCRSGNLLGQEKAAKKIEDLLGLNDNATRLIIKEKNAKAELMAAEMSTNPYAIAAAEAKIVKIHGEQEVLNLRQKGIIEQGRLALMNAQQTTARDLGRMTAEITNYRSLFGTSARVSSRSAPSLAVSPEGTDIAPTYRTDPDIEKKQALAHRWQYELRVNPHLQRFISGNFKFEKSCAVSVTEKGRSWVPKILRDKF